MDDGSKLRLTRLNIKSFNKDPVNLAFDNILYKVVCQQSKFSIFLSVIYYYILMATWLMINVISEKEEKIILDNVSGTFYAGRLTAIIGPSGAGKTTLLKILAGNKLVFPHVIITIFFSLESINQPISLIFRKRNITGKILVNGENRNLDRFQWQSSYVSQEASMLPSLTAKETLTIAANLKLSNTTQEEKSQIVCNFLFLNIASNVLV